LCLEVTTAANPSSPEPQRTPTTALRVSSYDRASSLLITLVVFVGFFVVIMFLIWLTTRWSFTQAAGSVTLLDEGSGRGEHAAGYERDWEEPGLEEVEELVEPQMEALLEAVTDAATAQAAALDALETEAVETGRGRGLGDSRQAGPAGEGGNALPRWQRWRVRFSTRGVDAYARQLDFFGIELAAAGGGRPMVDYAKELSKPTPTRRSGKGADEKRLYMTWREGALMQFDRQLLGRAGIDTRGRVLLQFYPPAVEDRLAQLERQELQGAGRRSVGEIVQTVFGVRRVGSGYEFYVVEQKYGAAPRA
jgi:hypothetical protein